MIFASNYRGKIIMVVEISFLQNDPLPSYCNSNQ